MAPMRGKRPWKLPSSAASGVLASNPSLSNEAALNPGALHSGLAAVISSSERATRCWGWALMP